MRYTPKGNRTQAVITVAVLLMCSLLFIGFSLIIDGFTEKFLKASSYISVLTAILVSNRFTLCSFTYTLEDFDLVITQNIGKSKKTVCRLDYTEITEILPYGKAKNRLKGRSVHNYCVTMFTKEKECVFFEASGEDGVIIFEPDFIFSEMLRKHTENDILTDR